MQKLTKEQAEYLISNIDAMHTIYCGKCNTNSSHDRDEDIKHLINQCTEKEFPEFEIWHDGSWKTRVSFCEEADSIRFDQLSGNYGEHHFFMNKKDILRFAAGLNKIVEHLNAEAN